MHGTNTENAGHDDKHFSYLFNYSSAISWDIYKHRTGKVTIHAVRKVSSDFYEPFKYVVSLENICF